jgi:hypothetical protein
VKERHLADPRGRFTASKTKDLTAIRTRVIDFILK